MRRPPPRVLDDIRHPGPRAAERIRSVPCHAEPVTVPLAAGDRLLPALERWAGPAGFASAVLDLCDLALEPFRFVLPDRAVDDRHVAWYSETHDAPGAVLEAATAIYGWRDGARFAHIHACWRQDGKLRLGHLLPETLMAARPCRITGHGLRGARFEAAPDPETEFTLFRPLPDVPPDNAPPAGPDPANALIATLAPFADLPASIEDLAKQLPPGPYEVMGLGSLAGAVFRSAPPMTALVSETLVGPGAGGAPDGPLTLPVRCVDLHGTLHEGEVCSGSCPTLVTHELLVVLEGTDCVSG